MEPSWLPGPPKNPPQTDATAEESAGCHEAWVELMQTVWREEEHQRRLDHVDAVIEAEMRLRGHRAGR